MLQAHQIEELICVVSSMDRQNLAKQFRQFRGNFPIDFTADFLDKMPVDRLRHILVALCLHAQKLPAGAELAAVA